MIHHIALRIAALETEPKKSIFKDINAHPARRLVHNGQEQYVDEEVADIVQRMWDLGVETLDSCQDSGGKRYIGIDRNSLPLLNSKLGSKPRWLSITGDPSKSRRKWVYIFFPFDKTQDFLGMLS